MTYRLCYIESNVAWFTTKDLSEQWGDDWDDAPYEHNAGEPYPPKLSESWSLVKFNFIAPSVDTPKDLYFDVSVEQINQGLVPWLISSKDKAKHLHAGATVKEFIDWMDENGGTVLLPDELLGRDDI